MTDRLRRRSGDALKARLEKADRLAEALREITSIKHDGSSGDMKYAQQIARAALADWEQK